MVCLWTRFWIAAILVFGTCGNAFAASDLVEKVRTHLYAGQTADAVAVANARLAEALDDDEARFALGTVQFLQAVERLGQGLHRYGLRGGAYGPRVTGLAGLPILRVPVPHNPDPQELTYDALRVMLKASITDLQTAETTLSSISSNQIDLPLNIGLIRLDLNGDGEGSDNEALWLIFKAVAGGEWLDEAAAEEFLTDFDASDVPWLRAYCHLLMAIAEFPLAHDWQKAFEVTFATLFHMPSSPYRKLDGKAAEARARIAELEPIPPGIPTGMSWGVWSETEEGREYGRIVALHYPYLSYLEWVSISDLIAFIHLNHWPVREPERMQSVHGHLEAMVQLSRENWEHILAETDEGRAEWIPNPNQKRCLAPHGGDTRAD